MSELFQASQAVSVADPAPAQSPLFISSPRLSSSGSGACCSPPWLFYLFCTNRVAADSFWFKKRRGGKGGKRRNAFWLFFLPRSWQRSRRSSSRGSCSHSSPAWRLMPQAAGQWGAGSQTHRGGGEAKVQLGWDRPQPWRDAAPNLMPPSSYSGKCPCPLCAGLSCPFPWHSQRQGHAKCASAGKRAYTLHPANHSSCDWKTKMSWVPLVGR